MHVNNININNKNQIKMLKNESFHPEVLIVDHFDEIINQIDIKTETLLQNANLNENERTNLNKIRSEKITTISNAKNKNLSKVKFIENSYKSKWSHVINKTGFSFDQKSEIIKENELIVSDCLLLEDKEFASEISLWLTSFFLNRKHLEFLR